VWWLDIRRIDNTDHNAGWSPTTDHHTGMPHDVAQVVLAHPEIDPPTRRDVFFALMHKQGKSLLVALVHVPLVRDLNDLSSLRRLRSPSPVGMSTSQEGNHSPSQCESPGGVHRSGIIQTYAPPPPSPARTSGSSGNQIELARPRGSRQGSSVRSQLLPDK